MIKLKEISKYSFHIQLANTYLISIIIRTRKLADAKAVAEQEINKYRREFEEKYAIEAEKVIPFQSIAYTILEKKREWKIRKVRRRSKGRYYENRIRLLNKQKIGDKTINGIDFER